jgi:hypothetical protein
MTELCRFLDADCEGFGMEVQMNELLWFLMLVANFSLITVAYRLWGKTGLYVWVAIAAIIANVQVIKTVSLFWMAATLGNIVYATSFLATDILSENHGKKEAKRAVYIGFFSLISTTVIMQIALAFEPHHSDFSQEHLSAIFGLLPRIALASLAAYWCSQLHDVWAYDFWKKRFPDRKHIWLRNNASTMVSQLIDTAVFTSLAFLGVFSAHVWWQIFWSTYILKWVVAVLDTPFIYLARKLKDEGKIKDLVP